MSASSAAAEILVEGRVQGVGYRAFVERRASSLGLVGHVTNLDDGRVRVYVEGQRAVIDALLRELAVGPRLARVTATDVRWTTPRGDLRSFGVRLALVLALILVAVAPAGAAAPAPAEGAARAHIVKKGDTLSGIARQYGVTVASIVRANGLPNEKGRLKLGTRISIPPASDRVERPSTRAKRASTVAAARRIGKMPANLVLAIPDFNEQLPAFLWPVEGGISSNFGRRRMGWHRGIDIVAPPGAPIVAAAGGVVIASGVEGRYGRVVKIAHDHGFTSVYAHNSENLVELGQWVSAGQMIGTVGRTGRATSEHVHFELRHEGMAYNPMYLLPLPPRVVHVEEIDHGEDDDHE